MNLFGSQVNDPDGPEDEDDDSGPEHEDDDSGLEDDDDDSEVGSLSHRSMLGSRKRMYKRCLKHPASADGGLGVNASSPFSEVFRMPGIMFGSEWVESRRCGKATL